LRKGLSHCGRKNRFPGSSAKRAPGGKALSTPRAQESYCPELRGSAATSHPNKRRKEVLNSPRIRKKGPSLRLKKKGSNASRLRSALGKTKKSGLLRATEREKKKKRHYEGRASKARGLERNRETGGSEGESLIYCEEEGGGGTFVAIAKAIPSLRKGGKKDAKTRRKGCC